MNQRALGSFCLISRAKSRACAQFSSNSYSFVFIHYLLKSTHVRFETRTLLIGHAHKNNYNASHMEQWLRLILVLFPLTGIETSLELLLDVFKGKKTLENFRESILKLKEDVAGSLSVSKYQKSEVKAKIRSIIDKELPKRTTGMNFEVCKERRWGLYYRNLDLLKIK